MEREAWEHLHGATIYVGFLNVLYESINEVGQRLFGELWTDYPLIDGTDGD